MRTDRRVARSARRARFVLAAVSLVGGIACPTTLAAKDEAKTPALRRLLDAPMLFVKRHSYRGIHIYDTQYKWGPGGGIYVLENPSDPPEKHRVRPVIDAKTPETLGEGIYSDPDISYDAKRVLFCFKGDAKGSTSIYEIGLDGRGLRRLTNPEPYCADYKGSHSGVHDLGPAHMPDGRIVFTSTRWHGLVPCANEGVDILHVMNADGSGIRTISVNNVNEFDPCVLPDGRILHGRWEYVDKTALTIQSLWTIFPDGTNETALFANNMVFPEALLDARPVPGSVNLIAASFTPHNSPPRGSIGIVDTYAGKDCPEALTNFENPDKPTHDRGNSCEPWPLSKDVLLFSGRPKGAKFNAIEIIDRSGRRELVYADPEICCHSPMLIKPRTREPVIPTESEDGKKTGRFYVLDIYKGLPGVKRGEIKRLRVVEETSRVSASPGGAFNQTFLMSAALAFSAKNFLGVVPVEADGSAYFEVPAGRALYLQALDKHGRLIQSMRTFVQAAPGVTRTCIGCHEHKFTAPANEGMRIAVRRAPDRPRPESWGSGYLDYPEMVQPILDKHCVRCHGGTGGFRAKLDLSGGWTEYFNISYENLVSRRETQLVASLISGIDCMNGTSNWSAQIFLPREHGSGNAPLAEVLVSGHDGRIGDLTRRERDLLMAWIDTNGLYHGTWNYTEHGCRLAAWPETKQALLQEMHAAGCMRCHQDKGKVQFEHDWFNLQRPERSRILRAPLAKGKDGHGLGLCREHKVDVDWRRVRLMATGGYVHHVLPIDSFKPQPPPKPIPPSAKPAVSFASTKDKHYQAMLTIIRRGRQAALSRPRVDMPDAEIIAGASRQMIAPPLPKRTPDLSASADDDGLVRLTWPRRAETIGLTFEVHRGTRSGFALCAQTLIATTTLCQFVDKEAPAGQQHYALVAVNGKGRSRPSSATVEVPKPTPPGAPTGLHASARPGEVCIGWDPVEKPGVRFNVYRAPEGSDRYERLNPDPFLGEVYVDVGLKAKVRHRYEVRAVSRRGLESQGNPTVVAAALPERKAPVFVADFGNKLDATLMDDVPVKGASHGKVRFSDGTLDLRNGGHVTFPHQAEFDLTSKLSIACSVRFEEAGQMPVVLCCGAWKDKGWFLQKLGGRWRWHVGGVDCDGGRPPTGQWLHIVATFDGRRARVYQDGKEVASAPCSPTLAPYPGPLFVGQYGPSPGKPYQVTGQIADVKVYRRAISAKEAAAMAEGWRAEVGPDNAPKEIAPIRAPFDMPQLARPTFPDRTFNVVDYGGVGDGRTKNTKAIAAAIEACAEAGGGKVLLPKGTWLTGAIHLKSRVNLHLGEGATLRFTDDPKDYLPVVFTRWAGFECYNYSPLIYARDCENIAVTGPGTIDGNGRPWWPWAKRQSATAMRMYREQILKGVPPEARIYGTVEDGLRPQLISPVRCKNVLLEGFTIAKAGPFWTIDLVYCERVIARRLRVLTTGGPNTDGLNVDSSKNVLIEHCYFNTGDDCICMKSGINEDGRRVGKHTENVVVRYNLTERGHGGVVFGSDTSGGIRNVFFHSCIFRGTDVGIRLKSTRGRGGFVERLWGRDIDMVGVRREAIQMTTAYRAWMGTKEGTAPVFRDMTFRDMKVSDAGEAVMLQGLPEEPIRDLRLMDITMTARQGFSAKHTKGVTLKNVTIQAEKGPALRWEHCEGLAIDGRAQGVSGSVR